MDAFYQALWDEHRIFTTAIHPQRWATFAGQYNLNWLYVPFEPAEQVTVPAVPGVYCFHIGHRYQSLPVLGFVLYHGITRRTLRERYGEYLQEKDDPEGRFTIRKMLKVFEHELTFACATVDPDAIDLSKLELDLGGATVPHYAVKDLPADVKARRNAWP